MVSKFRLGFPEDRRGRTFESVVCLVMGQVACVVFDLFCLRGDDQCACVQTGVRFEPGPFVSIFVLLCHTLIAFVFLTILVIKIILEGSNLCDHDLHFHICLHSLPPIRTFPIVLQSHWFRKLRSITYHYPYINGRTNARTSLSVLKL